MGRDKALIDIGGATLLERAVQRLGTVADPLLLASGSRALSHDRCLTVPDAVADSGPLGGLLAVLQASPHPLCAVVAVDMPDLDAGLVRHLARLREEGDDAVVPLSPRGPEPLHAVYARECATVIADVLRSGERSVHCLLQRLRVRTVDAAAVTGPLSAGRFARNLNTAAELTAWRREEDGRRSPSPR